MLINNTMKRYNIALGILFLVIGFNQLNAQNSKKTGYAVLNAGLSYPIADFADADIGGATSGITAQLTIAVPFVKSPKAPSVKSHFGIVGKINYTTYGMSNQPLFAQQLAVMEKFDLDSGVTFTKNTINFL